MNTIDEVLSKLVIEAHISTKPDKRKAREWLEVAFELGGVAALDKFENSLKETGLV